MKDIIITQVLATIQGEGISVGEPCLLIRVNGCNLNCSWCDTKWTNQKIDNIDRFDPQKKNITPFIIDQNNLESFISHIKNTFLKEYKIRRVLFTGGEPLLNYEFINDFCCFVNGQDSPFDIIEIETNGVLLERTFKSFIVSPKVQFNISPKFIEYPNEYYNFYDIVGRYLSSSRYSVKIVYDKKYEDQILEFVRNHDNVRKYIFTPMTPQYEESYFREKYIQSCLNTVKFCLINGFTYSPREHIHLFGANRDEFKSMSPEENL